MNRKVALACGMVLVFIVTVLILVRVWPGPHKAADYLVIGTLATFVCILLAFLIVISTNGKRADMFYKRKK